MIAIFFVLGLIIGSFLNVVIYRLRNAESIVFGGSKCPKCKNPIRWYDNIPLLSFLVLRARCRNCKERISWRYPLIEFSTAVIFSFLGYQFFVIGDMLSWATLIYYWIIFSLFIVIFVYDFLYMEIPMSLVWIGTIIALLFNIFLDFDSGSLGGLWSGHTVPSILASGLSFLFFFSLAYGSKEKWMGMGDAYLGMFLGMVVGGLNIVYALSLGFFLGAIVGIILIILKKKKLGSQLPLAPFLIVGSAVMVIWGSDITDWYMSLFI